MKQKSQNEFINKFIAAVKEKYPQIIMGYSYDQEYELFNIWHTNKTLQFENKEFLNFSGTLIKNIFFDNEIFNVSFGYDYDRDKIEEKSYVVQNNMIINTSPKIVINCSQSFKNYSLSNDGVFNKDFFSDMVVTAKVQNNLKEKNFIFSDTSINIKETLIDKKWILFEQSEVVEEGLAA